VQLTASRRETFDAIRALAKSPNHEITKAPHPRTSIPYLNEPWYC